ncbi:MAG: Uncharacterized protein XD76_1221 [candidate division TA06 bacterium 32_111]|uniref:Tryptophan-rich sensory protein n=2 Tax=Bacteria candidate phyla TaxID=1783234 RepID=A0A117M6G6_UNCT6|nr:MAG: Uncharacterized protein XD76_1221 [candidate division TA06 bacterium 32_111]KUK87026.1 MAG: Uncharacterized protein XE03_1115 [candidate division TA06 bacterium 34_109]HAF07626.1 hypothetical protein [candidate division WOR-3 bacterium]HCP15978.1 hypothetical protein [candidate division WOR-3 bacterium]
MNREFKVYTLIILNLLSLILMILFNFLAVSLPLNSNTPKDVADKYSALIVPESVTFSIWLIIYTLLALFVWNQVIYFFKKEEKKKILIENIGVFFFLSSILNVLWLFCWHYEKLLLSVFVMILLLSSLIILYGRLRIGEKDFNENILFVQTPISVYLGWISIATVANIASYLKYSGNNIFNNNQILWTNATILLTLLLGIIIVLKKNDLFYVLVFLWAYIGIILKQSLLSYVGSKSIIVVTIISIVVLIIFTVFSEVKSFKNKT